MRFGGPQTPNPTGTRLGTPDGVAGRTQDGGSAPVVVSTDAHTLWGAGLEAPSGNYAALRFDGGGCVWAGQYLDYTEITTTYTAATSDDVLLCDATGAAFTVTLPPAADAARKVLVLIKTDASGNAVTIDGDGAETINGSATQALAAQYNRLTLYSTGTLWLIIGA